MKFIHGKESMNDKLVVQKWVYEKCSWMEQTVIFCGLRGVDFAGNSKLKAYTRWFRRIVLKNANPKKTFMQKEKLYSIKSIANNSPLILDMLPVHYLTHLLHTFQVIAYRHPDKKIMQFARKQYNDLVDYLHLSIETNEKMTKRLGDRPNYDYSRPK
jgi:hypothetical protein